MVPQSEWLRLRKQIMRGAGNDREKESPVHCWSDGKGVQSLWDPCVKPSED